jgi:carboxypeptidase Q
LPRLVLALVLLLPAVGHAKKNKKKAAPAVPWSEVAAATTGDLLGAAMQSSEPYDELVELCDTIGNRLSGTPALDRAIDWAAAELEADGLIVTRDPVMVPVWVRGEESARMVAPLDRDLPMLGLGRSIATPEGGIEADVVVVSSFDELEALGADAVTGKIVVYDAPFTTYGETVKYRSGGASAAAKLGAVAALVRSIGPISLSTPHTGGMYYAEDAGKIPTAAITVEDAQTLHRLQEQGVPIRVRLQMSAHFEEDRPSANVIGQVTGREKPDEFVVVSCHLDSWDVGQGAQDDGAGCVAAMEVGRLIEALPQPPRRSVRVVLYTNEENGLRGGKAYAEQHSAELAGHVGAIEMDTGSGKPHGFRVDARTGAGDEADVTENARILTALDSWRTYFEPIRATEWEKGYSGADVGPLAAQGVLAFGVAMDTTGYWPIHHTEADTIDKIDPILLRENTAAMAMLTWLLADSPEVVRVQRHAVTE